MKLKTTEAEIQTAVCDYLDLKRYFFWRNNTIPAVYNKGGEMHFRKMPKYSLNGLPDIFVLSDGGYLVGLEIKSAGGKLSESQKKIEERFKEIGAEYHVIRSIDQVMELFK